MLSSSTTALLCRLSQLSPALGPSVFALWDLSLYAEPLTPARMSSHSSLHLWAPGTGIRPLAGANKCPIPAHPMSESYWNLLSHVKPQACPLAAPTMSPTMSSKPVSHPPQQPFRDVGSGWPVFILQANHPCSLVGQIPRSADQKDLQPQQ